VYGFYQGTRNNKLSSYTVQHLYCCVNNIFISATNEQQDPLRIKHNKEHITKTWVDSELTTFKWSFC